MVVPASNSPNFRSPSNSKRPPFLSSDNNNNNNNNNDNHILLRRPKSREIHSRYLSHSSSNSSSSSSSSSSLLNSSQVLNHRRCPSSATNSPAVVKRSVSAERKRPGTPLSSAARMMTSPAGKVVASSARSFSVSFQGESFAVPKSKPGPEPVMSTPVVRRGVATPERKRGQLTTPTTVRNGGGGGGQQPWPGRSRSSISSSMSRSVDLSGEDSKKLINGSANVVRALKQSLFGNGNGNSNRNSNLDSNRLSCDGDQLRKSFSLSRDGSTSLVSDSDSLSSECKSGSQDSGNASLGRRKSGNYGSVVVPVRVWQEGNIRMRNGFEPCTPLTRSNSLKGLMTPKVIGSKLGSDSPVGTPRGGVSSRGFCSPVRGSVRPSSPSKFGGSVGFEKYSPSRGMASPSRVRNGVTGGGGTTNQGSNKPSVLSFGVDVRRIKVGDNRLGDAHFLRLLHNRHLQWRYVNARTESSLFRQTVYAERSLYNAWKKISNLHGVISSKRKELQWLKLKLKLVSILKGQMLCLGEWAIMEKDHCSSLWDAAESLKASIVRLPVIGGARANIQDLKDAICSAADVMQGMTSSICSLLSKVEEVNLLVEEVASMTLKEHAVLNECKTILSTLAAMQVKDCSLRVHVLQLKYGPSNLTVKA